MNYKITLNVENSIHINWIHISQIVRDFPEHILCMNIVDLIIRLYSCLEQNDKFIIFIQ